MNYIEPNESGDDWLFEVSFEPRDLAHYGSGELELVEPTGHEEEIELVLQTSFEGASVVAREITRIAAETSGIETRSHSFEDDRLRIGLYSRDHPREAIRALMERLGSSWSVEDDGWYANVHWVSERFPIAGVDQATLFLRPWRDPRPAERLPRERYE